MENGMAKLKWKLLTEIPGRMEADVLKSYLEAEGIGVELFQGAVGHYIYPTALDRVQLFVSNDQFSEANELLVDYNEAKQTK
jgi:hypothetical protein